MMMTENAAAWMGRMVRAGLIAGFIMGGMLGGCARRNERGLVVHPVTVNEFARSETGGSAAASSSTTPPASVPATTASVGAAATQAQLTHPTPTPPASRAASPSPAARAVRPGEPVIVDSVIGQVSGRPIFADALLEPIADELRQESARLGQHEFVAQARQIVERRLSQVVLEQLFLAEAEASLTEQQQQGLLAFLSHFREKTLSEGLGSLSKREQELQEERGMTVDQYVELEKNTVLVGNLINQKIAPRVIVSWRDVEREYERRKDEFSPPAKVTFRRLRLSNTTQKELIDQVKTRLAAGESFDAVVQAVPQEKLGTLMVDMGPGGITDVDVNPLYKLALEGLALGQTSRAIDDPRSDETLWLHYEKLDQPPQRTLYDVQRLLIRDLTAQREGEERERYIKTLFSKGTYSELEEMSRRVLEVALVRYSK